MDYEKKYKEALKWMKDVYPTLEGAAKEDAEHYFPELKENEDEKIRNALIKLFKTENFNGYVTLDGIDIENVIAWLEKQGDKPQGKSALEAIKEENVYNANKIVIEPKFKVGDWIVNTITNAVEQIIEVTNNGYICSGHFIVSFENQHLLKKWTIQDTKNGDILVSKSNQPFIYNGKIDAQTIGSHGGVLSDGTVFACGFDDCNWTDIRFIYPATKEQCDLLFSKMREAGYKWDMEKKELKKLKG